jgi:hypothetical protein
MLIPKNKDTTVATSRTGSDGRIEDLHVPRDLAGAFHTQAFEHYSRY